MKKITPLLLCLCTFSVFAQTDSLKAMEEIKSFQQKLNEEYKDRKQSPLTTSDFNTFQGHDFFPVSLDYRVNAKLAITEGTPFFQMKTTTDRLSTERVFGYITFQMAGKDFKLPVYQSKALMATAEYSDYLFFPFTDNTNGKETYDGGRYIDLRIPKTGDAIVVDFNMAYNPFCAYSAGYSCPIVPAENQMDIEIPAGVKYRKPAKNETVDLEQYRSEIISRPEVLPEYPGGYEAMATFIGKNMTYPKAAEKAKIQGTVYVQFIVEMDGSLSNVRTLKGISAECDKEAERVVSMMPKWKPGRNEGEDVPVKYILPINFKGRKNWNK